MTWEYRSTVLRAVSFTEPMAATRPTSLRPRSTSMTCSAFSFGSARSSASSAASSAASRPRRRVPAMGRSVISPSCSLMSVSGEEPTSARSPSCR